MAVLAAIKFTQGMTTAAAGTSLIGVLTTQVVATNGDNSNVQEWTWEVLDVPLGSAVQIGIAAAGAVPSFAFVPDLRGGYLIRLTVKDAAGNRATDTRCFQVLEVSGRLIPPFTSDHRSLNFGSQLTGWAKYMREWLKYLDTVSGLEQVTPITFSNSPYDITSTDDLITYDTTAGAIQAYLPDDPVVIGKSYTFREVSGAENFGITITRQGAHTIEGSTSMTVQSGGAIFQLTYVATNLWKRTLGTAVRLQGATSEAAIGGNPHHVLRLSRGFSASGTDGTAIIEAISNYWGNNQIAGPTTYTATIFDSLIRYNVAPGAITLNLPTNPPSGFTIITREVADSEANALTVAAGGGGLINGLSTYVVQRKRAEARFVHLGSNTWVVMGGLVLREEGTTLTGGPYHTLDFLGAGVTAADAGHGKATVTISAGASNDWGTKSITDADSPYTVLTSDHLVRYNASSGAIAASLPVAPAAGFTVVFKEVADSETNAITITPGGGGNIDGVSSIILQEKRAELRLIHLGTNVWTKAHGLVIKEDGTTLAGGVFRALNFIGAGVTATNGGDGIAAITVTAETNNWGNRLIAIGDSPYTVVTTDHLIRYTTAGGALVANLPNIPATGFTVIFRDVGENEANWLTINPAGGGTIEGFSSLTLAHKRSEVRLVHLGSNIWSRLGGLTLADESTTLLDGPYRHLAFLGACVTVADNQHGKANVTVAVAMNPAEIVLLQAVAATDSTTYTRVGGRKLSSNFFTTQYPATRNGLTRTVKFIANLETSDAAATANVRLYNVTDAEQVFGTNLSTTNTESTRLDSGTINVGASSGELREDKLYEVQIARSGGVATDQTIAVSAVLEISYS